MILTVNEALLQKFKHLNQILTINEQDQILTINEQDMKNERKKTRKTLINIENT